MSQEKLFHDEHSTVSSIKKVGRKGGIPLTEKVTKDMLEELYLVKGMSLEDIARQLKCTRPMVQILMEGHSIKRRNRSTARILAIKGGKFKRFEYDNINEDFFAQWSPAMAWVLGLLFTDGNIQSSKKKAAGKGTQFRVSLWSIDLQMLENVRRHLGTTKPIIKSFQPHDNTKHIYRLEFYRERMREDLIRLGLVERKSLTMKFPKVPEQYMRHFIRGCWDGDGTVYLSEEKIEAKYVSGSKNFMTILVDELFKFDIGRVYTRFIPYDELTRLKQVYGVGKYPLRIYEDHRSKNISYSIKLNSRDNIKKLFDCFYNGVDESMYLKRKYDVFVKGLSLTGEELKKHKENEYQYTPASTRPIIMPKQFKVSEVRARHIIKDREKKTQKRVMKVNNSDGKLKCFKCSSKAEEMFVTSKPFCRDCFFTNVDYQQ